MKKIFLVLCCLFVVTADSFAQKCHLDEDKKDPFSGEIVRSYKHEFVTNTTIWWMQFDQKGKEFTATLASTILGREPIISAANTKILFKLENGTILELVTDNDVKPFFMSDGFTRWIIPMKLSEPQLKQFSESPITDIRYKIESREMTCANLKGKHAEKIMNGAKCMLRKD